MERAARGSRRKAARIGLLAAFLGGCAAMQEPPGGPPDYDPPVILAITPDSGAVVENFKDPLEVRFDEVIDERSGSALENLVLLSPRPDELNVSWKRDRIAVRPKGGWRENTIYHLTLLPGFTDLRSNRTDSGRTVVFSTGGEIPDTRITGTVIDWEAGRAAPRALIEATLLPDSLVYVAAADSSGNFGVSSLTPGSYLIVATIDQNNNRLRDPRESFDSAFVQLDSTVSQVLWAFVHDTVGPRIGEASELDSVTMKVDFEQKLVPGRPQHSAVSVYELPDTTLLEVVAVWNQVTYDSIRAIEAVEDSLRQAATADSLRALEVEEAPADTIPTETVDTIPTEAAVVAIEAEAADSVLEAMTHRTADDSAAADTGQVARLLSQRPQLSASWYVRLASSMVPGARYLVRAVAENVSGAVAESQGLLIIPEPADTLPVPADTLQVPVDTLRVPPDTLPVPPDST